MVDFSGINYSTVDFKKLGQIGKNDAKKSELENGLTKEECENLDTNKDGLLTEEEFKAAWTDTSAYSQAWATYLKACNVDVQTSKNGKTTITQEIGGKTTITTLNKKGVVTDTAFDHTVKAKDGAWAKVSAEGKIERVATKDKETNKYDNDIKFSYNDNGQINGVSVDGQKYKNIKVISKGNKTVIKNNDTGKTLIAITANDQGQNTVHKYDADGKRTTKIVLAEDGTPSYSVDYNKDGSFKTKTYYNTNRIRTYEKDENGKTYSTDFNIVDGDRELYSIQSYQDVEGSTKFDERYFYKDGAAVKKAEYDFSKNPETEEIVSKKTVSKAVKNAGTPEAEYEVSYIKNTVKDKYGNIKSTVTQNAKGELVSSEVYNYATENPDKKLPASDLKSVDVTTPSKKYTKEYNEGKIQTASIISEESKKNLANTYSYEYYPDGSVKTKRVKNPNKKLLQVKNYDEKGELTSTMNRRYHDNGKVKVETTWEDGKITKKRNYDENGELTKTTKNKYNDAGQLIRVQTYNADNKLTSTVNKQYHANGELKTSTTMQDGKIIRQVEYNDKGEMTLMTKNTYNDKGELIRTTLKKEDGTYEVTKFENGEPVTKAFYDKDKKKTQTHYAVPALIKDKYPNVTDAQMKKILDKFEDKEFKNVSTFDKVMYYSKSNLSSDMLKIVEDVLGTNKTDSKNKAPSTNSSSSTNYKIGKYEIFTFKYEDGSVKYNVSYPKGDEKDIIYGCSKQEADNIANRNLMGYKQFSFFDISTLSSYSSEEWKMAKDLLDTNPNISFEYINAVCRGQ